MPGNYSHTTRATGTILTASIYNGDHQNHIDNQTPQGTDDYSSNVTQMQTISDPGEVGTESLATAESGELERLRFIIKEMKNSAQWYSSGYVALLDSALNELVKFTATASAVNQVNITNAATTTDPIISPSGDDTNIGLRYRIKGTGIHKIQDSAGTDIAQLDTAAPTSGLTGMLLIVNDGAVTSLRRVSVGAVDSGGAGFRLLRVPN